MSEPMIVLDNADAEFAAYASSGYSYEDAERLAWFWGQEVYEAKLRIGRKIKWRNNKILGQMLYDAEGQWNWIRQSPYTYDDAVALADSWGVPVEEAKVVGGHMISGWIVVNEAIGRAEEPGHGLFYMVERGDSLSKIAKAFTSNGTGFSVSAEAIFEANRDIISNPDLIYPGQMLRIPMDTWGE